MEEIKIFFKKHYSNIIFAAFLIILFTPFGLPIRTTLIKGVSYVTTRIFTLEVHKDDQNYVDLSNWKLLDINGEIIDVTTLRKDQPVVLNVWATWCPPCIAEMPSFQKLYEDYKNEVTFIFLAKDELEKVYKFTVDKGYTFPVYFISGDYPSKFQESNSIPQTFILDKESKVIVNKTGAVDWNSGKVRDLLDHIK